MYGEITIENNTNNEEVATTLGFGQEWNPTELKLVDRVKQIKRQKLLHEGDALLTLQDFIGFAKTSKLKAPNAEDYLYEEGAELQHQLIHEEDFNMEKMEQEQLDVDEEEELHINRLVKHGTMGQKQGSDCQDLEIVDQGTRNLENKVQKYERSKEFREAKKDFEETKPDELMQQLEQQIKELDAESQKKLQESMQREKTIKENDESILARQAEIEQTGTLFVTAKEALDVIQDFEEMLEAGLASDIEDLVNEKIKA